MKDYHEVASEMTQAQRQKYFRLAAEIQNRKTVKLGFKVDAGYCHEIALVYLEAANWNTKNAKLIMTETRAW
jgi:hypothetical protein